MCVYLLWLVVITAIVTVLQMESFVERHAIVRTVKIASNLKMKERLQLKYIPANKSI